MPNIARSPVGTAISLIAITLISTHQEGKDYRVDQESGSGKSMTPHFDSTCYYKAVPLGLQVLGHARVLP